MSNNIIHNKDGVIIEEIKTNKPKKVKTASDDLMQDILSTEVDTVKLSVNDYLCTLVTYLQNPYIAIPVSREEQGKCVLCGVETNRPERKICPTCLKEIDLAQKQELIKNGVDLIEL